MFVFQKLTSSTHLPSLQFLRPAIIQIQRQLEYLLSFPNHRAL